MNTTSKAVTEASMLLRTASGRRTANNTCRVAKKQASRQYSSSTSRLSGGTPLSGGYTGSLLLGSFFLAGGASLHVLKPTRPTLAETPPPKSSSQSSESDFSGPKADDVFVPTKDDYQAVYDTIAEKLIEEDDYDDGSYAPVLLRLGWHSSGTYDAATNTGGSNGATMRFPPEGKLPPNSGLRHARDFLKPVKAQYPWISYSDLWTLGAVCAVQEMSGPSIPWRPGRKDKDISYCAPDGRLPIGSKGADHVRAIYNRMGFNDQEIVALIGAHAVGRCHTDRSGFEGPWTFSPITFTNDFYRILLEEEWYERDWNGPRQFQNKSSKTLVMLPTDHCLVEDGEFKKHVEKYAADQDVFFDDFSKVMVKLFELGVPFDDGQQRMEFDRTE